MSVVKGVKRIARSVTWCKATGFVAAYYTAREPDQRKTWRALYADIHAAKYNTGTRRRHCHAAKSTCSRPILSTSLLIRIRPPIVSDASTDGTSVPCSLAQNVGWQHEFKIYRVAQKVGRKFVHIVAKYWPNFNFFHQHILRKIWIKWLLSMQSHFDCVSTQPCETCGLASIYILGIQIGHSFYQCQIVTCRCN